MSKYLLVLSLVFFLPLNTANASRASWPAAVEPFVYNGVKYIVPEQQNKGEMGYVEAYDIKANVKLWEKRVYEVKIDSNLEPDVQWVFITDLNIRNGKLIVVNERNEEYGLEPATGKIIYVFDNRYGIPAIVSIKGDYLTKENLSIGEFNKITSFYYQEPKEDKLVSVFKVTLDLNETMDRWGAFRHFFVTVACANQKFYDDLKKIEDQYSGAKKETLARILNEADNFRSPKADTVVSLAYLWAEFIATGSQMPINKILNILNQDLTEKNVGVISQAKWLLLDNSAQHKRIYQIINEAKANAMGTLQEKIIDILNSNIINIGKEKVYELGYDFETVYFDNGNEKWLSKFTSDKELIKEYSQLAKSEYQALCFRVLTHTDKNSIRGRYGYIITHDWNWEIATEPKVNAQALTNYGKEANKILKGIRSEKHMWVFIDKKSGDCILTVEDK